ncbi:MAG TPA: EVE domain-containing protein [Thermoanaerobaculia bacterium]|nr:EVE domain-containing protein [Thermoanaerobaculia bacterium]
MRYWVNTISRNHVQNGLAGGFTQADHGSNTRLKRLSKGDGIVFYSPRAEMGAGETVRRFTAIGEIVDEAPYQVEIVPEFRPWRRAVKFRPAAEAPIEPLIESLEFIRNKKSWGFIFRRGLFEIEETDFKRIEQAMMVG